MKSTSNPHIRMISEGPCDTKDWWCWKFIFDHRKKLHFKI